jgi:hypothetical protein
MFDPKYDQFFYNMGVYATVCSVCKLAKIMFDVIRRDGRVDETGHGDEKKA